MGRGTALEGYRGGASIEVRVWGARDAKPGSCGEEECPLGLQVCR